MKHTLVLTVITLHFLAAGPVQCAEIVEIGLLYPSHGRLSADGRIFVGQSYTPTKREAVIWSRDEGERVLGTLPGHLVGAAVDVSADGSVVVGYSQYDLSFGSTPEAFLWTEAAGMIELGVPPGFVWVLAGRVSDDGSVIVGTARREDNQTVPFRWTADGGMSSLGLLPGSDIAYPTDLSADGSVVVGYSNGPQGAFIWNEENGLHDLGPPPQRWTAPPNDASLISADGSTIFGSRDVAYTNTELYRWTQETGTQPLIAVGYPRAMTPDASVVVGEASRSAFVWDAKNGRRNLRQVLIQDHGLTNVPMLVDAKDISDDGTTILASSSTNDSLIHRFWAIYLDKPLVSFGILGDYNGNGTVEQADLDLVLLNWGGTATPSGWTHELPTGAIDQNELDGVLLNWGNTAASGTAAVAAVPEPTGAVLLLVCLAAAAVVRTRIRATGG